jgi:hypothetical protein
VFFRERTFALDLDVSVERNAKKALEPKKYCEKEEEGENNPLLTYSPFRIAKRIMGLIA